MRALLLTSAALTVSIAIAAPARAHGPAFGPWSPASPLENVNSPKRDGCPITSHDGQRLYIASDRDGGLGGLDIYVAERSKKTGSWGTPTNLGPAINSADNEFCPSPGRGGRFMFVSNRKVQDGCGGDDIYKTRFVPGLSWRTPQNLGCTVNSPGNEAGPVRVPGALYFSSTLTPMGKADIYRSAAFGPWLGTPQAVEEINSPFDDARPYVRRDGREIVFDSNRPGNAPPDIWAATREHPWGPWSAPAKLSEAVNSPAAAETRPSLSSDGRTLYFGSTRGASQDVYTSTRER